MAASLFDHFRQLWNDGARAGTLALVDDERELTYPLLYEAVSQCAGWLQLAGVRHGHRVAIAMERSSRLAVCILGVMAAGGCPCPLEPRLGAEEARRRTRVAGFEWIVFDDAHAAEATDCGLPPARGLRFGVPQGTPAYWSAKTSGESDGFLLFTSGSSGKPKGVLQNHRGMLANAQGIVQRTGLSPADRLLHVMPLHHTNGVNNQLLAPLLAGSSVVLANRFRAEAMPQLLERHRPTLVTGVPTMYARMLPLEFSPASLAALRMLRCGSAPITEELHRRIEEKFGLPLVVSYGLSEATCTSTMNPPGRRKIGSVGTTLQGQHVFLRGADGRSITQPGAQGEICIAGPSLMTGYLLEAEGLQPADDPIRTGDLGRFDEEGYLYITGRLKDVIIRGGENLSPHLIEEVIVTVPGVAACCVVGRSDADLGEVPVAFVVRDKGRHGAELTPAAIAGVVTQKLSRIHQPAECFFLDSLPENATGKVDRKRLREAAGAH